MATVLVTGGSGFIGSHLCQSLVQEKWVKRVVNLDLIVSRRAQAPAHYTFIREDVTNPSLADTIGLSLDGVTHVVHLAGMPGVQSSIANPIECFKVNVLGTINLMEICRKMPNLKRVIIASSSSVYGDSFPSSDAPVSPYATSKKSAEIAAKTYSSLYGIEIVCARLFTVYGPGGRPDMAVARFISAIEAGEEIELFGVSSRRSFTYVADVVKALTRLLQMEPQEIKFISLDVGYEESTAVGDLAHIVSAALDKPATIVIRPRKPGDVISTKPDSSVLNQLVGYSPDTSVKDGIGLTVDSFFNSIL